MPGSKRGKPGLPVRGNAIENREDIRLHTPLGTLAGLRWCAPHSSAHSSAPSSARGTPVLCVHGWLDNAASFIPLSQHLHGMDIVALDLPGHGHSYHRHLSAHYYFMDYLWDIDMALDALGWSSCHLVGHSLGAAILSLYAAICPRRVRSLVLLDALGPMSEPASASTARLRRSLDDFHSGARPKKAYDSIEAMIKVRQANTRLAHEPARLICERSAEHHGTHYEWSNDPALYWVSPILMTEEQALDYLGHITAPVLSLTAIPFAPYVNEEKVKQRCAVIAHGRHLLQEGGHHFHMDQPAEVASTVGSFILEQEQAQEQPQEQHDAHTPPA
jgi:pimeloyl-ACP methyl ester carboxylesterase